MSTESRKTGCHDTVELDSLLIRKPDRTKHVLTLRFNRPSNNREYFGQRGFGENQPQDAKHRCPGKEAQFVPRRFMAVATCYLKEKMRFLDKWIHAFVSVCRSSRMAAQRLNAVGPGQNDGPMLATPQLRPSLGQPNRSTCQADTQQGANDTCDRSNRW